MLINLADILLPTSTTTSKNINNEKFKKTNLLHITHNSHLLTHLAEILHQHQVVCRDPQLSQPLEPQAHIERVGLGEDLIAQLDGQGVVVRVVLGWHIWRKICSEEDDKRWKGALVLGILN